MTTDHPFHIMTKPTGAICNLDCTYCFYLNKESLYPGSRHWAMPDEVLDTYIPQYIEAQPSDIVDFAWQDGEPTFDRVMRRPKHRFLQTPDGASGLNYLCESCKYFFHHIDPHMQFMAEELRAGRAPANIMQILGDASPRASHNN